MHKFISKYYFLIISLLIIVPIGVFLLFIPSPFVIERSQPCCSLGKDDVANHRLFSIQNCFQRSEEYDTDDMLCYTMSVFLADFHDVSFLLPAVNAPASLYIDDVLISANDNTYTPPKVCNYHTEDSLVTLKLFVSNRVFDSFSPYFNPLRNTHFIMGDSVSIMGYINRIDMVDCILIHICVLTTILNFTMFFFRRDMKTHLYLALFSISIGVGLLLTSQQLYHYFVPRLSTSLATKLLLLVDYFRVHSLNMFAKESFSIHTRKPYYKLIFVLTHVTLVLGILAPNSLTNYFIVAFILIGALQATLFFNRSIFCYSHFNLEGMRLFAISTLILILGCIYDILNLFAISSIVIIFPVCQIIFIIIHVIRLSRLYSSSFNNIQNLTPRLKSKVFEMQENKSTYISSHIKPVYLYETLESIKNNISKNQEKVDVLIQSLSKYLRSTLDFSGSKETTTLSEEIDLCNAYIDLVKEQHPNYRLYFEYQDNVPNAIIPRFSIQAVIENAVSHAFIGVLHPTIKITITSTNSDTTISIHDNGIGMSQKDIDTALNNPTGNIHIGLYHINQLLIDNCNTRLMIESQINRFTKVSFTIKNKEDEISE